MLYYVDGYNFLFRLFHSQKKFETQRELVIDFLQKKASLLEINIHLVFDGYKQSQELSSMSYFKNLKVIYTPQGQTADDYILEKVFLSKNPSQIQVITSDNNLIMKAKEMHAQTKSIESFIAWISQKEQKIEKRNPQEEEYVDTKQNIKRLLKIFEEKMKNDPDDWH